MISARTPGYSQKNKTSDANPPKTKRTEKNTVQATETASSTEKNKKLSADALGKGKAPQLKKNPKAHQTGSPLAEKIPASTKQEKDLAPPEKTEKTIKKERIKSSPDAIGEATKNQKKSLDALKEWAKVYKKTENCSSATQKTINDIVQTVEEALDGRQLTVDLAKHASAFSALKGARRKALRSALKPFNVTGLNEAKEKKASPQPPLATTDLNTNLERTAPLRAERTLQLSWDNLGEEFENIIGDYFERALKVDDISNLQHDLDAFAKAFLVLKEKGEVQTPDFLGNISNGIQTVMTSMLSQLETRIAYSIKDDDQGLASMKSLLIKLQGNESMQSMRDIWKTFASAWNKDLPEGVTTIETDLVHFKRLEEKVAVRLPVDHPPVNLLPVNHLPVEKVSKAALPYNQENAWAAYNKEYEQYRIEDVHNKLMDSAKGDLAPYVKSFEFITAEGSKLSPETARQMVLQRSLVDFVGLGGRRKTLEETNMAIMGCKKSYFDENPTQSAQEVAFIMKTPIFLSNSTIKTVTVLTVAAPALDSKNNPVWGDFVGDDGQLDKDVYRQHYHSLCTLIKQASGQNQDKRVVISAVGMGAFIEALSKDQQDAAKVIAADELAQLAKELVADGRAVAYTDVKIDTENAQIIQKSVVGKGMNELPYAGKLTDDWMNENDLYINAGDPHSCAGNGGNRDASLEGRLGRYSLMSDIHVQVAINAQLAKTTQQ